MVCRSLGEFREQHRRRRRRSVASFQPCQSRSSLEPSATGGPAQRPPRQKLLSPLQSKPANTLPPPLLTTATLLEKATPLLTSIGPPPRFRTIPTSLRHRPKALSFPTSLPRLLLPHAHPPLRPIQTLPLSPMPCLPLWAFLHLRPPPISSFLRQPHHPPTMKKRTSPLRRSRSSHLLLPLLPKRTSPPSNQTTLLAVPPLIAPLRLSPQHLLSFIVPHPNRPSSLQYRLPPLQTAISSILLPNNRLSCSVPQPSPP
jgi:hypothetical protein